MSARSLPILYSFRRCPYAMRARLALASAGVRVELREIVLRDKPPAMLAISHKATVPVLQLPDGQVIDESYDIMKWALKKSDPHLWLGNEGDLIQAVDVLVTTNDQEFKPWLDRYKYADRYPEHSPEYYRDQCELWFSKLNHQLETGGGYLLGERFSLADAALLPFIRQCAHVDKRWFETTSYHALQHWLEQFLESELFQVVMKKYALWQPEDAEIIF
ncbi:MAG: glutathione S-transferase [Oceanospirillaceae bacterium]|nr:glutathione S-transferase [Oceanospirillaceae bacterium]